MNRKFSDLVEHRFWDETSQFDDHPSKRWVGGVEYYEREFVCYIPARLLRRAPNLIDEFIARHSEEDWLWRKTMTKDGEPKTLGQYRIIAMETYGPDSHSIKAIDAQIKSRGPNFIPGRTPQQMLTLMANWDAKTGVEIKQKEAEPESNPAGDLLRALGSKQ